MQNNNYLDELKLILGLNYEISDSLFTVAALMKMDITDVIANVMELNRKANEEVFLQVRINEIKQKFTTHRIPISKFNKITIAVDKAAIDKYYINQTNLEDNYTFVEENLMSIKHLLLNPYSEIIRKDSNELFIGFQKYLKLLDEISAFQNHWLASDNFIFYSDFVKEFPGEYKKVTVIDNEHKKLCKLIKENGLLAKYVGVHSKVYEPLKKLNKDYEQLYETIEKFLIVKKNEYIKFYFLDNQELLEAYSSYNYLEYLNKYVYKMINKIQSIEYTSDQDDIAQITTADNEIFNIKLSRAKIVLNEIIDAIEDGINERISTGFRVNIQYY